jgi:hypothetical protein
LSDHSGIVAGDDDVMTVKAGESGRISTSGRAVYVKAVSGTSTGEIHAQNFSDAPFKSKAKGGGQSITVEPLTVNDNGVYTAPTGKAYSPVSVDVQEQPWQPLQDGYSNFWFELTDDTLSPWLNFSAKTENAVIDWGDGSGEQALDTLTPTHTYAKAGKYVVKVKGVTGINRQQNSPYVGAYLSVLKYVELNSEIVSCATNTFVFCVKLQSITFNGLSAIPQGFLFNATNVTSISIPNGITVIPQNFARNGYSLASITIPNNLTSINSDAFYYCVSLTSVIIPSTVTEIGSTAFASCNSLNIIHIQATTPPTLGTNVFSNIASNFIIYVPVGYAETYKAAAGWSTYADHILEDGQTPNRMMLAKFNSTKAEEVKGDELYQDNNR